MPRRRSFTGRKWGKSHGSLMPIAWRSMLVSTIAILIGLSDRISRSLFSDLPEHSIQVGNFVFLFLATVIILYIMYKTRKREQETWGTDIFLKPKLRTDICHCNYYFLLNFLISIV